MDNEIVKRDFIIKDKSEQLRRIYRSKSWRLLTGLVYIKRQLRAYVKTAYSFIIVSVLFLVTFIFTVYLFFLKKIRKITVFPGG